MLKAIKNKLEILPHLIIKIFTYRLKIINQSTDSTGGLIVWV